MRFSIIAILSIAGLAVTSPIVKPRAAIAVPVSSPLLGREEFAPVLNHEAAVEKRETALNAFLALLLEYLPAFDGTINAVVGILTTFEEFLAALTMEQTTYNEAFTPCKEYTVIFARGTTEPGNVGILVGPPFFDALDAVAGAENVVVQGVNDYAADIEGYLAGGDPQGSAYMATQIENAYAQCPNTKLIVSGYSQGGQIVHNAANLLPQAIGNWISKVIIFGDPLSSQPVANVAASKTKIFCNVGDDICVNGDLVLPPHLLYGLNAAQAAAFAVS